jgi:hypothetical protein
VFRGHGSCSARVDVALILGYAVQMSGIRLLRCVLGFSVSWVLVVSERAHAEFVFAWFGELGYSSNSLELWMVILTVFQIDL